MMERISGVSLATILILLIVLTAVRVVFLASRAVVLRFIADLLESAILAVGLVFLVLRPFVVQSFYIPSGSMRPTLREGDHLLVDKWVYRFHPPQRGDIIVFRAPPQAAPDQKEFIKRVIGLPGDTISVQAGFLTLGRIVYTRNEILATLGANLSVDEMDDPARSPSLRLTRDAIFIDNRRVPPEAFARAAGRPGLPVQITPGRVLRNGDMLMEGYVAEDAQYDMPPRCVPDGELFVMGDNRNQSLDSHVWGFLDKKRVIGRADVIYWPTSHMRWLAHP